MSHYVHRDAKTGRLVSAAYAAKHPDTTTREEVTPKVRELSPEEIARVAHEVNRAYCEGIGDTSQLPWEQAPEWQRSGMIAGINFRLANPNVSFEDGHNAWLERKVADGWVYGEVKDAEAKTHPCIKPYNELPPEQQMKDRLFFAVVSALRGG